VRRTDKRPKFLASVILANIGQVTDGLAAGAVIMIGDTRVRSRQLPIKPAD
jgi:hypothetical protein